MTTIKADDATEESPIDINAVIADAKPHAQRRETVVQYERGDGRLWTAHVVDGNDGLEIDRLAWEELDHSDHGTKIPIAVDDEIQSAVLDAARRNR